MDVFVINLRRSSERRRRIVEQLEQLGINYSIFPAIDAAEDADNPLLRRYDNERRLKVKVRPLSKGEIACFASHYSLWEKCVQLSSPIVILEDDVLLDKHLAEVLADVEKKMGRIHYLRLGRLFERRTMPLGLASTGHRYVKYLKPSGGAQGYVIDPAGAARLLRYADRWVDPVDCYMDKEWCHGLPSIGVEPTCVSHVPVEGSDIGARGIDSKKVGFLVKIKREVVRAYEKGRDTAFNAKFVLAFLAGAHRL